MPEGEEGIESSARAVVRALCVPTGHNCLLTLLARYGPGSAYTCATHPTRGTRIMTLKEQDTTYAPEQAQELEDALDAQYRADTRQSPPAREYPEWG